MHPEVHGILIIHGAPVLITQTCTLGAKGKGYSRAKSPRAVTAAAEVTTLSELLSLRPVL